MGSVPASAASGVNPTTQVTVMFNRLIDPSTVTSVTFSVWTTTALAGHIQVAGDSVVFTPDNPLDLFATHSVRLTEAIRSTAGDRLPASGGGRVSNSDPATRSSVFSISLNVAPWWTPVSASAW